MAHPIEVHEVWKSFRLYEQKVRSLKELMVARRAKYETFWALRGVSFDVHAGEMLGLVGANGSGKSTMLKCLARILVPNSGEVAVRGKVSALLELGAGFHPELTGRENLYLGGSLLRLSKADIDDRFDDIVAFSELASFIDQPVKNYSSGMYARLAFALAVNVEPEVLLIDEVLSVGDEKFAVRSYEKILELRKSGATIVFVSHALDAVRALCTRVVWMEKGVVRQDGPAADVIADYFEEAHTADHEFGGWLDIDGVEREGNGDAKVTSVRLMNGEYQEHWTYCTGGPLHVNLEYETRRPIEDLCATIEIRTKDDGELVSSVTSGEGEIGPLPKGGGTIQYFVPVLPFWPGEYTINVALHDAARIAVYEWTKRAWNFTVLPGDVEGRGDYYLAGGWSLIGGLPDTNVS